MTESFNISSIEGRSLVAHTRVCGIIEAFIDKNGFGLDFAGDVYKVIKEGTPIPLQGRDYWMRPIKEWQYNPQELVGIFLTETADNLTSSLSEPKNKRRAIAWYQLTKAMFSGWEELGNDGDDGELKRKKEKIDQLYDELTLSDPIDLFDLQPIPMKKAWQKINGAARRLENKAYTEVQDSSKAGKEIKKFEEIVLGERGILTRALNYDVSDVRAAQLFRKCLQVLKGSLNYYLSNNKGEITTRWFYYFTLELFPQLKAYIDFKNCPKDNQDYLIRTIKEFRQLSNEIKQLDII